jgi:hypothetical protein
MHILYFVVLPKAAAATSKEAITEAKHFLENNAFADYGYFTSAGLWGRSKCDWYEVGGRWSGLFTLLMLPKEKRRVYEKELSRIDREYHRRWDEAIEQSKKDQKKRAESLGHIEEWREQEILQAWQRHFPDSKVICPQARRGTFSFEHVLNIASNYGKRHDTDDAVLMTKMVWRKFRQEMAKHWKSLECVFTDECMEYSLSEVQEKDALGKWWVVVDYHT